MAGRIPQAFIDDLLARTDIVEVIDERVPLRKAGRNYTACCPFHNEKTPSFSVSPDKQFYYCFGCGASGSAIGFLMDYAKLGFVDAVHELAGHAGLEVPDDGQPDRRQQFNGIYTLLEQAAAYYARQLREHAAAPNAVAYLKQRGLSGEIAAEYGLGFAPPGWDNLNHHLSGHPPGELLAAGLVIERDGGGHYDRFRDRIMYPIHDQRGRVIGFGGRSIGDAEPKYLNSPETPVFHKGRELYGLYQARKSGADLARMLVVEGYMDVLALAQYGVRNVIATLGTATTGEHLERLFRISTDIVFCFDGDRAGRSAAWRALENSLPLLQSGRQVYFLFLPEGEDPDSLVRGRGADFFTEHRHLTALGDFLFEHLSADLSVASLDGRARLTDRLVPLLKRMPEGAYRHLLSARLAQLSQLPAADINALLDGASRPPTPASPASRSRPGKRRHSPSLVRSAITLLLRKPALALRMESPTTLENLQLPGIALLLELLEIVHRQPDITTGMVLEHFRDRDEKRHLETLLGHELPIDDEGLPQEFDGVVQRLGMQSRRQRLNALLQRQASLDPDEKRELADLLQEGR